VRTIMISPHQVVFWWWNRAD